MLGDWSCCWSRASLVADQTTRGVWDDGGVPAAKTAVRERAAEWGILPSSVSKALASYPHRPAEWPIDLEVTPPAQPEVNLLAKALREALTDGHREAHIVRALVEVRIYLQWMASTPATRSSALACVSLEPMKVQSPRHFPGSRLTTRTTARTSICERRNRSERGSDPGRTGGAQGQVSMAAASLSRAIESAAPGVSRSSSRSPSIAATILRS